ncbi:MAG: ATP-dependent Clp protease adaptor ClpS [Spirochaetaceae bacterium]|nr:ATP-dependent Clp protease adaptor ClpS [Spirochaetaceae bacterium]
MAEKTLFDVEENVKDEVKEPGKFVVILHNDHYTTMDFVVTILKEVFHKTPAEANKLMLDVHKNGRSKVAVYPYDIAATKVCQVENLSARAGFPLRCTMEKE